MAGIMATLYKFPRTRARQLGIGGKAPATATSPVIAQMGNAADRLHRGRARRAGLFQPGLVPISTGGLP